MSELYEYGIMQEDSNIRAHVSVDCKSVFVFQTQNARDTITNGDYRIVSAYQPGVKELTARGWLVPPDHIDDMRRLSCRQWPGWNRFSDSMTTSEKGAEAVNLVLALLHRGRFPIWIKNQGEATDRTIQIQGVDVVVHMNQKIQIKCDWQAGPKEEGCSGHLFLQKAERNPNKNH